MSADYVIFVDESFYKWFGLPTKESNFCYGGLSLPATQLPDLDRFEASIRQFAFNNLPASEKSKRTVAELKYSDFRHLSNEVIDTLGIKLNYFLAKNRAYIFGFFIPAEGFMNYKLRSDFIDVDTLKEIPEAEYKCRIQSIREKLIQDWREAEHNLGLLTENYKTFFNFILQFQGRFLQKQYRIVYDSRNPDEDSQLHRHAEEFARLSDRRTPGMFAHYRGYSTASSGNSAGLRLVDWIAGEVRTFFYRSPEIMNSSSSFDILSPYWNPKMILVEGVAPFYRKPLSRESVECLQRKGNGLMLPHIRNHFASGLLTYYARCGEARHLSIPGLVAYDMAD